jgi:hypothetical protein
MLREERLRVERRQVEVGDLGADLGPDVVTDVRGQFTDLP